MNNKLKRALYESIMKNVSREVKHALNKKYDDQLNEGKLKNMLKTGALAAGLTFGAPAAHMDGSQTLALTNNIEMSQTNNIDLKFMGVSMSLPINEFIALLKTKNLDVFDENVSKTSMPKYLAIGTFCGVDSTSIITSSNRTCVDEVMVLFNTKLIKDSTFRMIRDKLITKYGEPEPYKSVLNMTNIKWFNGLIELMYINKENKRLLILTYKNIDPDI